jgi:hypothetical protein
MMHIVDDRGEDHEPLEESRYSAWLLFKESTVPGANDLAVNESA